MKNKLRKALLDHQVTLGAWMQIGHPACAEVFARETMANIFRAIDGFDSVPAARLPMNDPIWIHRSLDAGARALIIPMVKTAAEAESAIREAKYPPRGTRGFGYSRANLHGMDFVSYIAGANDEIAMIMQIEHKDAIADLEAIVDVPGVDGLFIGPLDLSGSMGITGQLEHPDMVAALERYRAVCRGGGKSFGLHVVRPTDESIRRALDQGYTLIALGLDTVFLEQGSRACLQAAGRLPGGVSCRQSR